MSLASLRRRRNLLLVALIVVIGVLAGAFSARSTASGGDTPVGVLYIGNLRTPEVIALSIPNGLILQRYPLPVGAHEFVETSDGALYASMYRGQAIARLKPSFALIPTAPRPHGMVALPDGVILLTLGDDGAVAAISPDGTELWRATVGPQPHAIALSPNGLAYIANGGDGTVSMVDVTTHRELARIPAGAVSEGICIGTNGDVYVANAGAGTVTIIDPLTFRTHAISMDGQPVRTVPLPTGGVLVSVAGPQGALVALGPDGAIRWRIPLGLAPDGIALDPSGKWAFVSENRTSTIHVVDLTGPRILTSYKAGDGPSGLFYSTTS